MRPDGCLIHHLRRQHMISNKTYEEMMGRVNPKAAPGIPTGRPWPLAQVQEEPASSHRDRRQERKEKQESSRKRHK